jgi:hypothetical protein
MSTNYLRTYEQQIKAQPHDIWSMPLSARKEAKFFLALIANNRESPEEIRALIDVSPKDVEQLEKLVAETPALKGRIESALEYRKRVRMEFDALMEKQRQATASPL